MTRSGFAPWPLRLVDESRLKEEAGEASSGRPPPQAGNQESGAESLANLCAALTG